MTLRLGEVVLIRMQFHQAVGSKVRPALVILDSGDYDFVAAPVTSPVLAKADIVLRLGVLSTRDHESLEEILCQTFCPQRALG